MWGKQNDGQMIQNQPAQPAQPAPAQPTTMSQPRQAPQPASTPTVFGKSMKIVGEVTSDEELYLDGDLDANIKAQEIVVFGTIKGNVESETRVSLRTGASIVGDIKTAGIVIEDGAYFKGGIDISRNGDKSAPKVQGAAAGQKQ